MMKTTQKELKEMVRLGIAKNISTHDEEKREALLEKEGHLEQIAYSHGTYGINGALLQGYNTGSLYALTCRNTTLFMYV